MDGQIHIPIVFHTEQQNNANFHEEHDLQPNFFRFHVNMFVVYG
jgi:hypothetical protein